MADHIDPAKEILRHLQQLKAAGVTHIPWTEKAMPAPPLAPPPAEPAPVAGAVDSSPAGKLDELRREIGDCRRCRLGETRTRLVFGTGSPEARLLFVGEAPGFDEDKQGEPFVGKAGKLLTRMIEAIGLKREEVYICNVIKCRPPENRNPESDEINTCEPFLMKQIEIIRPKAVCALGKFAAQTLLKKEAPISTLRGRVHDCRGIPLVPTYHPAYLLRNPEGKRQVWEDLKSLRDRIGG